MEAAKTSPELSAVGASIHHQFERLRSVSEFLEKAIKKETKKRGVKAKRQLMQGTEEERAFNSVFIDASLFEIERDFPQIVRYSLVISLMSTIEACLVRLCRVADKHLAIVIPFKELGKGRKSVITQALDHLHEKGGIDLKRMDHYTCLADNLRKLRNAITHSEGCINGRTDEAAIQDFANSSSGINIDQRMYIVLSDRFVGGMVHVMHLFVNNVHRKLRQMPPRSEVR